MNIILCNLACVLDDLRKSILSIFLLFYWLNFTDGYDSLVAFFLKLLNFKKSTSTERDVISVFVGFFLSALALDLLHRFE